MASHDPRSVLSFQSASETLVYEPFFKLTEKAFSLNSDLRFHFESPSHASSLKSLLDGIRRREGLIVLTGEIGSGKTTLCRAALKRLGRKTFSSFVPDPFASREDLLKTLLIDFGVVSLEQVRSGALRGASRTELSCLLAGFLESMTPSESYAVVFLDEAQNLTVPMIEETRVLHDTFGASGQLQIVFVGQLELHEKLKASEMRQVDQRIMCYTRLAPLNSEAVGGYIRHRLRVAGHTGEPELFPADAIDVIYRRSGGIPRLINRICDRALTVAYARQSSVVDRASLDEAFASIGSETFTPTWASIVFSEPAGSVAVRPDVPHTTPNPITPETVDEPARLALDEPAWSETASDPHPSAGPDDDKWLSKLDDWSRPIEEVAEEPIKAVAPPKPPPYEPRRPVAPSRVGLAASRVPQPPVSPAVSPAVWPWRLAIAGALAAVVLVSLFLFRGTGASDATATREPEAPARSAPSEPVADTPPPAADTAPPPSAVEAPIATPPAAAPALVVQAPAVQVPGPVQYFVAIGLYNNGSFADMVVAKLAAMDLPAQRRSVDVRGKLLEQVVLGPFESRTFAAESLARLQEHAGYGDARVIQVTVTPLPPS